MSILTIGHRKTSEGLVIHEDGTVTHYLSGEESPEKIAKFEEEQKANREKKLKKDRKVLSGAKRPQMNADVFRKKFII